VTLDGSARLDGDNVRVGAAYEQARGEERHRVAALKRPRRVQLSETLSLVFENRDTIRSTLEEALRTERIDDPERVVAEIAAFNAVVPEPGQLAGVLFLEVADPADLSAVASDLEGIERAISIEVGGSRVLGITEAVSPPGESVAAHYLHFALERGQRDAIIAGAPIAVGVEHPHLTVTVPLDEDQQAALAGDLTGPG